MHQLGQRHQHEQTAAHQAHRHTPYIVFLNKTTFIAGVIGPLTVLPQIYSIFTSHSAQGVSLATWALIFVVTFPWILYGIAHRDKSIIISFTLWEIVNLVVVAGIMLYR